MQWTGILWLRTKLLTLSTGGRGPESELDFCVIKRASRWLCKHLTLTSFGRFEIESFLRDIKTVQVYLHCGVEKMTIRYSVEAGGLHTDWFFFSFWMVVFLLCWSVSPCCGREGRLIVLTESWGSTLQSWLLPGRLPPMGARCGSLLTSMATPAYTVTSSLPLPSVGLTPAQAINSTWPVLFCLFIGSQNSCHHTYCLVTGYSVFILLWLIVKIQSKGFYLVL